MNRTQNKIFHDSKYMSSFPSWLRFLIFIKQGFYNGTGGRIKMARLMCWFDRHEYTFFFRSLNCKKVKLEEGQVEVDGYNLSFTLQCKHCGYGQEFEGDYRGHSEHRIKSITKTR